MLEEYPKDAIIKFFRSVVNPALVDCDAGLRERGWKTDLQLRDPADPLSWFDNTLDSKIYATKAEGVREFSYLIFAHLASSGSGYYVKCEIGQHGTKVGTVGGHQQSDYRRDIHAVSKEVFLKDVETWYNEVKNMG
jgi:hypothetical protein